MKKKSESRDRGMDRYVLKKMAKFHCRIQVVGTEGLTGQFFQVSFLNFFKKCWDLKTPTHKEPNGSTVLLFYSLYLLLCATKISISGLVWLLSSRAGRPLAGRGLGEPLETWEGTRQGSLERQPGAPSRCC